jgi:hypothetical protein
MIGMELRSHTPESRQIPPPENDDRLRERLAMERQLAALLDEGQQQIQLERRRLLKLRERLKRRWHKHWTAERQVIRRQHADLAAERRKLQAEREQHHESVVELLLEQRRCKAETEAIRAHLRADRDMLYKQREELALQQQQLKLHEPQAHESADNEETSQASLGHLERLAGELADQRLVLAEQMQRFALARQRWDDERAQAIAELEAHARGMLMDEHALRTQERTLLQKEGTAMDDHEARVRLMIETSRLQREFYEKQIRELRDELEGLARALLKEAEAQAKPEARAA